MSLTQIRRLDNTALVVPADEPPELAELRQNIEATWNRACQRFRHGPMRGQAIAPVTPEVVDELERLQDAYLRAKYDHDLRNGLIKRPSARLKSPARLRAHCRRWQKRWERLKGRHEYVPAETVRHIWQTMRRLARKLGAAYPDEPAPPRGLHDGIRALDPVVNWCMRQALPPGSPATVVQPTPQDTTRVEVAQTDSGASPAPGHRPEDQATHDVGPPPDSQASPGVRENVPSVPDGDAVQPIVALGARQYRIGHTRPVVVDEFEDNVLQTFLELRTMDQPTLEDLSGVHHAPKVLKRLREKYGGMFAAAITLPGGRGKGGSHVEITKPA